MMIQTMPLKVKGMVLQWDDALNDFDKMFQVRPEYKIQTYSSNISEQIHYESLQKNTTSGDIKKVSVTNMKAQMGQIHYSLLTLALSLVYCCFNPYMTKQNTTQSNVIKFVSLPKNLDRYQVSRVFLINTSLSLCNSENIKFHNQREAEEVALPESLELNLMKLEINSPIEHYIAPSMIEDTNCE